MSHPCHARRPVALVLLLPFVFAACGGGGVELSANDMQVCYYAHDSDAERVYEHADEADSNGIVDLTADIEMGSSDARDESAMRKITEFCEDSGYDYDKDGRYGRDDERTTEDPAAADDETTTDEPTEASEPSPTEPAVALPTDLWGNGREPGAIEKADLGEHWPFKAARGTLHCVGGNNAPYLEVPGVTDQWYRLTPGASGADDVAEVAKANPPDDEGMQAVLDSFYGDNGLCVTAHEDASVLP